MQKKNQVSFFSQVIYPLYRFLISLKLAVILILALMIALTVGTVIESRHGADAAKIIVYDAPYFSVLLCLLALNVLLVALSRWPWKKKHIGFLLTHLGIILMLAGSLVTRYSMTDGQIVLAEGEGSNAITLPQPVLEIHRNDEPRGWVLPIPGKPFPWEGRQKMQSPSQPLPLEVHLLNYYPKARSKAVVKPSESGSPAIEVKLSSSQMGEQSYWLIRDDVESGAINLGPARMVFSEKPLVIQSETPSAPLFLIFKRPDKDIRVDLPNDIKLPYPFPIPGTDYRGEIQGLYRNAVVSEAGLSERPGAEQEWQNPAIKLKVTGPGMQEDHIVFSNFPDFGAIHGHTGHPSGMKILFHAPHAALQSGDHELRFILDQKGELNYQLKSKDQIVQNKVTLGETLQTGWMAVTLNVSRFYPHAAKEQEFEPKPNIAKAGDLAPAVRLEVAKSGEKKIFWLGIGMSQKVQWGEDFYQMTFGRASKSLNFTIRLKDFIKKDYPGTSKAASFSSDIELIDTTRGVHRDVHISMNEPLDYRGFKFYQSGYSVNPGEPEISIFSAANDPGIPLKYAGAIVMVAGILVMMIMKKYPQHKKAAS